MLPYDYWCVAIGNKFVVISFILQTQEASDIKHGAEEIILGQLRQVGLYCVTQGKIDNPLHSHSSCTTIISNVPFGMPK